MSTAKPICMNMIIPHETSGYSFQLVRLSVRSRVQAIYVKVFDWFREKKIDHTVTGHPIEDV